MIQSDLGKSSLKEDLFTLAMFRIKLIKFEQEQKTFELSKLEFGMILIRFKMEKFNSK